MRFIYGRRGDEEDGRVVGCEGGVGEDGDEVGAVFGEGDVLLGGAGGEAGVVGAEEDELLGVGVVSLGVGGELGGGGDEVVECGWDRE